MTSNRYEEDDLSDMYQLCEVIRLQETGPKEANKSLRNVFKYGDTHSQLRGLTILKTLVDNCGESFQAQISTPKFIELLKSMANSSTTDPKVHKSLMLLLSQWSNDFKNQSNMYAIAHLYDSVNHKAGFSRRNSSTRPVPQIPSSTSSKERRESLDKSNNKGPQSPTYSPEKEIGMATQNATNLLNAIILLTPNANIEKDPEIQKLFRKCKDSSEQLGKIIPFVMDSDKLGPLLQANDQTLDALSKYLEIHKDLDLIDFDSFSASSHSADNNIVYDNSLLEDPFADPFSDPILEPELGNKTKKKYEW
ncbi:2149_t:CDS:10 [Dentiscutata erythropus]|uniref:2149_t:CDS:1 n=1 Tax=Dentiscutata erythropus TaxID=1348616 RepID=A0A9N9GHM3_9GLOM|nr:2149_t:CDS:10 [Dentiscutata erythropus]